MAPIWECKLSNSIKKLIYCKAINIDLECYDDSQYYNDFSKAVSKCHDHIKSVMNSVFLLTNVILGFSANIILLCSINPFLICFVLVPFSALAISIFINKINYKPYENMVFLFLYIYIMCYNITKKNGVVL